MLDSPLGRLRLIGLLEGSSFLALLFVGMPLKYLLGMPLAVRVLGSAHGFLFVAFVYLVIAAALERSWPLRKTALALGASVVPFGTFAIDRSLAAEDAAERAQQAEAAETSEAAE